MATIIHKTNSRCVLYIKPGAANMAGACIHTPAGAAGVAGAWFIRTDLETLYSTNKSFWKS